MKEATNIGKDVRPGLEETAGARIDALEAELNGLDVNSARSQESLRGLIRSIRDEAARDGLPILAVTAEKACTAGAAGLRDLTRVLLSLLRNIARGKREAPAAADDLDAETGLLNREGFARRFEQLVQKQHVPAAIAAIHVDSFEAVCHRHGNDAARQLIAHVAAILTAQLRQDDCLAHFSGDEFMILLPGEDEPRLRAALLRLELAALRRPFRLPSGACVSVTISSGGFQFLGATHTHAGASPGAECLRIGLAARTHTIAKMIARTLRDDGCEVITAGTDGSSRYAQFTHQSVRLVILECDAGDLPLELGSLRSALSHDRTPILVLAANEEAAVWAIEHGASHAVVKPIEMAALSNETYRLASRGHKHAPKPAGASPSPVLVSSDDLYHLIALGSALQKHGGYEVRLGRGSADTIEQMKLHEPSTAVLDLRLDRDDTREVLRCFAQQRHGQPVVLITEKNELLPPYDLNFPPVATVIHKPVSLLTIAGDFRKATGIEPRAGHTGTAGILRDELLRVMRSGPATHTV